MKDPKFYRIITKYIRDIMIKIMIKGNVTAFQDYFISINKIELEKGEYILFHNLNIDCCLLKRTILYISILAN